ncbi:alpha/beta fold hydrolase [Nocardia farcinica]|uniref:alpha/beta fold hydrolase n=1 Tax=Nocardia farcinica TaxID=37329 RepID=UPI002158B119|nr:alpha/beta hydrolase [Nocardia farcinica]
MRRWTLRLRSSGGISFLPRTCQDWHERAEGAARTGQETTSDKELDLIYIQRMVKLARRLTRPGAEIAFADFGGDGSSVVLIHGAGVDHSMFDEQVPVLTQRGYRVIVWDLRGHGQSALSPGERFTASDALEDLDALLAECGVDAPVLVGHSLGGNLAQAFAQKFPQRVGGVIVLDSTWNAGPLSALERFALRLAAPGLAVIPAGRLPRIMARASATTPEAMARTEALFTRIPKRTFLDVWRATASFVAPEPGYRSPVPLALVRGAEDRTGNIATAMPRWADAEGLVEHVIPGAGHMVTMDAPAETSRLLVSILDGWDPRPVASERRSR